MSKKKVEIKNVPLEATAIANVNRGKHSILFLIFLFAILIGIVFYLPNLLVLYNQYFGDKSINISGLIKGNNTTNNTTNNDQEDDDEEGYYIIDDNLNINVDKLTFSNFKVNGGLISYKVVNNNNYEYDLKKNKIVFEFYNTDKVLLNYFVINNIVDASGELELNINSSPDFVYINIKKYTEEDYPLISLSNEENGLKYLLCTNTYETIKYFYDQNLLKEINYSFKYNTGVSDYQDKYNTLQGLSIKYNSMNGLSSNFLTNSTGFTYILDVDHNVFNGTLDESYYYSKDTSVNVVNFEMYLKGYNCS